MATMQSVAAWRESNVGTLMELHGAKAGLQCVRLS
jgi:hypothetical protein